MYRGSTTAYYSYLNEQKFGATAIILSEGIDEGKIIFQKEFGMPSSKVDIDYIFEPWMRSEVLIDALRVLNSDNCIFREQDKENAETYFIIHPVLKHIALLKMEKEWSR